MVPQIIWILCSLDSMNYIHKKCVGSLYVEILNRNEKISKADYNLVEIWCCEWRPVFKKLNEPEKVQLK